MRIKYPEGMEDFVRENAWHRRDRELQKLVNDRFGLDLSAEQIRSYRKNRRIINGMPTHDPDKHQRKYTPEMVEHLRRNIEGKSREELARMMTERFGFEFTINSIHLICSANGLKNSSDGRFVKGMIPANKGTHPPTVGRMAETQFKKGHSSENSVPVGTEKVREDGYTWIKIQGMKGRWNWMQKHRYIWIQNNGPIPDGMLVTFRDGNRKNLSIENLMLISKAQNSVINKFLRRGVRESGMIDTALAIADLKSAIRKREEDAKDSSGRRRRKKKGV